MINLKDYIPTNPDSLTSEDPIKEKEAREYMDLIPEEDRHGNILILGAGDGVEIHKAKELGFTRVKGIVSSFKEKTIPSMKVCDMHKISNESQRFDYVYSKETLEHSPAPYIVLCEVNKWLKEDGKFCITISQGIRKQRDWYHFSCFPSWVWVDLFLKAELEVTHLRESGFKEFYNATYWGFKKKDRKVGEHIELYSLEDYFNAIKKV